MIDLGISKLALIGVVALVVIGPEKLPRVARMAGTLLGRAQRYINQVKAEVSREMELDELRKMQQEMHAAASEVEQSIAKNFAQTGQELHSALNGEDDRLSNPLNLMPVPDQLSVKARDFRKKRLVHTSAVPAWYKRQSGRKTRVISAAARVAKYRPRVASRKSSSFFN